MLDELVIASMSALDLLIALILAIGLLRGLSTGAVRQVISVAGQLIGFVLALQLMEPVGSLIAASLGLADSLAPLLGFVLVFLAIQVGLFLLVRFIEALIGTLKLSGVDRVIGGALGALKAAVVLSVVFLVVGFFDLPGEDTRSRSTLYEPVASVLPDAWDFLSERMPQVETLSEKFGERIEEELP